MNAIKIGRLYDKLILAILFASTTIIPLSMLPSAADPCLSIKYFLFKTLAALALGLFVFKVFTLGTKFRKSGLEGAVITFFILMVVATLFSNYRYTSLEGEHLRYDGLYSNIIYIVMFVVAIQALTDSFKRKTFLKASVVVGALVSFLGILQAAGIDTVPWANKFFESTRSFSTFGNPILLVPYLLLLLPVSIALFIGVELKWQKAIFAITSLLIGICIFTSMSRAAWIASIIGIIVQLYILARMKNINIRKLLMPITIFSISLILVGSLIIGTDVIAKRATSIVNVDKSFTNRVDMWGSAIRIIRDYPMFGCGPDAIGYTYPKYETIAMARSGPRIIEDNVHNIYLQLAATSGIPAAMVFFLIIATLLFKARKYLNSLEHDNVIDEGFITSGLVGGIAAYLIQGFTGISGIETSTFLWLFMGVLASQWAVKKSLVIFNVRPAIKVPAQFTTVLIVILVIYSSETVLLSGFYLGNGRIAERSGDLKSAAACYQTAIDLNGRDEKAFRDMGIMLADFGQMENDKGTWLTGIDYLKRAVSNNQNNHLSQLLLGQGYLYGAKAFDKKYYRMSESSLKKALELRPNSALAMAMLGVVYHDTGRTKQASESLARALYINEGDPHAHYYYGKCFEKTGKLDEAKRQYAMALKIDASHERARLAYESLTK